MKNEALRLGVTLFLITSIAAGILAFSNNLTADKIKEVEEAASKGSDVAGELIPGGAKFEDVESDLLATIQSENEKFTDAVKILDSNGTLLGYGIRTFATTKGYGGDMELFVGITTDHAIAGLKILLLQETPGLGSNVENDSFKGQFIGKNADVIFSVIKTAPAADSEISAVAGATISSLSFTSAINNAVLVYDTYFNEESSGELIEEPEEVDVETALIPGAAKLEAAEEELISLIASENSQFVDLKKAYNANDELIGYAIRTWSTIKGFYDHIEVYVGLSLNGEVTGMSVMSISETPGLGTSVENADFQDQFIGKDYSMEIKPVGAAAAEDEISTIT
ncbi:MAG: FMN-binding protein, partial [Eubacteriales bacterium]|nr:FMN-binding protein [Eubacteriales bacterium]